MGCLLHSTVLCDKQTANSKLVSQPAFPDHLQLYRIDTSTEAHPPALLGDSSDPKEQFNCFQNQGETFQKDPECELLSSEL